MFERHSNLVALRGFAVVLCLALISGCGPTALTPLSTVPANLTATAGNAQVVLSWTAGTGATSYNVKRATTSGGPYVQLAAPTTAGYTDSAVTNGTMYYYVVSALDAGGESANSAQVAVTPGVAPAAPSNLTGTPGNAQTSLSWSASSGATSYNVKRGTTSGGAYTQLASVTTTTYTDTSVTNGTTYYYVVSAVASTLESANSAQVSVLPAAPPPTNLGTWIDVTPPAVDLTDSLCGNYGSQTVQADTKNPGDVYAEFNCQGIWKSTDYGTTWTGPINTGTNGTTVSSCGSGISVSPTSAGNPPTVYEGCIRGTGLGFWKSVDGGVNWTQYAVTPTSRQDYYPPVVDPYDPNHLLMGGHEFDSVVESIDGGQTWTSVTIASGMIQNGGTGFVFFINTGTASTTRGTWLWIAQQSGGAIGTWRTTNGGTTWAEVDHNEHPLGAAQVYQPDTGGVVYMAGVFSAEGAGVLRSADYGQTWAHVGLNNNETAVVSTSKDVYSMYGIPVGPGGTTNPVFEVGAQPGNGTWVAPGTPSTLMQGAAQMATVNNGTHNIVLGSMWNSGVWQYIEP
jgi:hypothetical protein